MSFRSVGGLNRAPQNNYVRSQYLTTQTQSVATANLKDTDTQFDGNVTVKGGVVAHDVTVENLLTVQSLLVQTSATVTDNLIVSGVVSENLTCAKDLYCNQEIILTSPTITTNSNGVVPKSYVDAVSMGVYPLQHVRAIATTDVSLPNPIDPFIVDGITMQNGYRVLLAGQSNAVDNGIYVVSVNSTTGGITLTRSDDMNNNTNFDRRRPMVPVIEGTQYSLTTWLLSNSDPTVTVGITAMKFAQFFSFSFRAGSNLYASQGSDGTTIDINVRSKLVVDSVDNASGSNLVLGGNASNVQINSAGLCLSDWTVNKTTTLQTLNVQQSLSASQNVTVGQNLYVSGNLTLGSSLVVVSNTAFNVNLPAVFSNSVQANQLMTGSIESSNSGSPISFNNNALTNVASIASTSFVAGNVTLNSSGISGSATLNVNASAGMTLKASQYTCSVNGQSTSTFSIGTNGILSFQITPQCINTPASNYDLTNKLYVDNSIAGVNKIFVNNGNSNSAAQYLVFTSANNQMGSLYINTTGDLSLVTLDSGITHTLSVRQLPLISDSNNLVPTASNQLVPKQYVDEQVTGSNVLTMYPAPTNQTLYIMAVGGTEGVQNVFATTNMYFDVNQTLVLNSGLSSSNVTQQSWQVSTNDQVTTNDLQVAAVSNTNNTLESRLQLSVDDQVNSFVGFSGTAIRFAGGTEAQELVHMEFGGLQPVLTLSGLTNASNFTADNFTSLYDGTTAFGLQFAASDNPTDIHAAIYTDGQGVRHDVYSDTTTWQVTFVNGLSNSDVTPLQLTASGATLSGKVEFMDYAPLCLAAPNSSGDLTNKEYVDTQIANVPQVFVNNADPETLFNLAFTNVGGGSMGDMYTTQDLSVIYDANSYKYVLSTIQYPEIAVSGDGTVPLPTANNQLVSKDYVDSQVTNSTILKIEDSSKQTDPNPLYLMMAGGASGVQTVYANEALTYDTNQNTIYVNNLQINSGGTASCATAPSTGDHLTNKTYVDTQISSVSQIRVNNGSSNTATQYLVFTSANNQMGALYSNTTGDLSLVSVGDTHALSVRQLPLISDSNNLVPTADNQLVPKQYVDTSIDTYTKWQVAPTNSGQQNSLYVLMSETNQGQQTLFADTNYTYNVNEQTLFVPNVNISSSGTAANWQVVAPTAFSNATTESTLLQTWDWGVAASSSVKLNVVASNVQGSYANVWEGVEPRLQFMADANSMSFIGFNAPPTTFSTSTAAIRFAFDDGTGSVAETMRVDVVEQSVYITGDLKVDGSADFSGAAVTVSELYSTNNVGLCFVSNSTPTAVRDKIYTSPSDSTLYHDVISDTAWKVRFTSASNAVPLQLTSTGATISSLNVTGTSAFGNAVAITGALTLSNSQLALNTASILYDASKSSVASQQTWATTVYGSTGSTNKVFMQLSAYKQLATSAWNSTEERFQFMVDNSSMGFIGFNPPSSATLGTSAGAIRFAYGGGDSPVETMRVNLQNQSVSVTNLNVIGSTSLGGSVNSTGVMSISGTGGLAVTGTSGVSVSGSNGVTISGSNGLVVNSAAGVSISGSGGLNVSSAGGATFSGSGSVSVSASGGLKVTGGANFSGGPLVVTSNTDFTGASVTVNEFYSSSNKGLGLTLATSDPPVARDTIYTDGTNCTHDVISDTNWRVRFTSAGNAVPLKLTSSGATISSLAVTGTSAFGNNVSVTGALAITGGLSATTASTFGNNVSVAGALTVTGSSSFSSNMSVNGVLTLTNSQLALSTASIPNNASGNSSVVIQQTWATRVLNSSGSSNNVFLRLSAYKQPATNAWNSTEERLQFVVDNTFMGFIGFNPPSSTTLGTSAGAIRFAYGTDDTPTETMRVNLQTQSVAMTNLNVTGSTTTENLTVAQILSCKGMLQRSVKYIETSDLDPPSTPIPDNLATPSANSRSYTISMTPPYDTLFNTYVCNPVILGTSGEDFVIILPAPTVSMLGMEMKFTLISTGGNDVFIYCGSDNNNNSNTKTYIAKANSSQTPDYTPKYTTNIVMQNNWSSTIFTVIYMGSTSVGNGGYVWWFETR